MWGFRTGRIAITLIGPVVLLTLLGPETVCAQSVGPDEIVNAKGVSQPLALTEAQKTAIYNAVLQQRVRPAAPPSAAIPAAVGASVPPVAELADLPAPAADSGAAAPDLTYALKYAMVDGDVVVVDPVGMRVVGVIHGRPVP